MSPSTYEDYYNCALKFNVKPGITYQRITEKWTLEQKMYSLDSFEATFHKRYFKGKQLYAIWIEGSADQFTWNEAQGHCKKLNANLPSIHRWYFSLLH